MLRTAPLFLAATLFLLAPGAHAEVHDLIDRGAELRQAIKDLSHGPVALRPVAKEAQEAIDGGSYQAVHDILGNAAKKAADTAQKDEERSAYEAAAEHYEQAAMLIAALDDHRKWAYLIKAGEAYFSQTDKRVDDDAAYKSIDAYERALQAINRKEHSLDWARTQDKLGEAYHRLGSHNDKLAPYLQAYAHFTAALEERRRDLVPDLWARSKRNVCNTLRDMAELDKGSDKARETMACFQEVLQVYSKEKDASEWAWTQLALGNAYLDFGPRQTYEFRLKKAIEAFKAALAVCTRDKEADQYPTIAHALGRALMKLGKMEKSAPLLHDSIAAFRDTLGLWTREEDARDWATTQSDLGDALLALGLLEKGTEHLREAAIAYQEAMKEWTPETDADSYTMTRNDLAKTRALIAERESLMRLQVDHRKL